MRAAEVTNPEYTYHYPDWCKLRDCVAGQRRIHERGATYLPALSVRTDARARARYEAYKKRAQFVGYTSRTLEGWIGAVFRKAPSVALPRSLAYLEKDVDLSGTPLVTFARRAAREALLTGRAGVLVDRQRSPQGRPYLLLYKAEEIINWEYSVEDGVRRLVRVLLEVRRNAAPGVAVDQVEERRELRLVLGQYQVTTWRQVPTEGAREGAKAKTKWVPEETVIPVVRGAALDFIPFVFLSAAEDIGAGEVQSTPLLSVAELNLHDYTLAADRRHALHFAALPTPVASGGTPKQGEGDSIEWGSGVLVTFVEPEAKIAYVEPTCAGLKELAEERKALREDIAALGAAYLTAPTRTAETAEALQLKNTQATSPLGIVADGLSTSLTRALGWVAFWEGANPEDAALSLSKDFERTTLTHEQLGALVESLLKGAITPEVFAAKLVESEFLPAEIDPEKFKSDIEKAFAEKAAQSAALAQAASAAQNAQQGPGSAPNEAQQGNQP